MNKDENDMVTVSTIEDSHERGLVTFNTIEDERGGLTRYELTDIDGKVFFLREALDNKGGPINEEMAWAIADEKADEIRAKKQDIRTEFFSYDQEKGVWRAYSFAVDHTQPGFTLENKGLVPQCFLEKFFEFSLARTEQEFVRQSVNDIQHMNSTLPKERELIEKGQASRDPHARLKADAIQDYLLEKEAIQKKTQETLEQYLILRGKHAEAMEKASKIEQQMQETLNKRLKDDKEEDRTRNQGR